MICGAGLANGNHGDTDLFGPFLYTIHDTQYGSIDFILFIIYFIQNYQGA